MLSVVLWALYRFTQFGLATEAVAENERAAVVARLVARPHRHAQLGARLGARRPGRDPVVPIVTLQVTAMTNLVLAAIAAALVAGFRSFPIAFAAGVAHRHRPDRARTATSTSRASATSLPFLVIIVVLVFRGQALPLRDYFLQRLPTVGSGRINWPWIAFGVALAVLLLVDARPEVDGRAHRSPSAMAIVLLSIVVLTGYAGQLSLAQFAIAGFGACVAGRLVAVAGHRRSGSALLARRRRRGPARRALRLPAVRTRGINLAIVTLGLGTAIELMLFSNTDVHRRRRGHPGRRRRACSAATSTRSTTRRATASSSLALLRALRRSSSPTSGAGAAGGG